MTRLAHGVCARRPGVATAFSTGRRAGWGHVRRRLRSAGLWMLLLVGCPSCSPPQDDAPVVVLVSWDTTRADALGCYADLAHWGADLAPDQRPKAHTPVVDALCSAGQRFDWALAHAPTTLNSHASLFTGLDPHQHAVPRNGFPLPAGLPTLATRFSDAGWDTVGVVGASVLAADMGLARGFRVYDDTTPRRVRRRYERDADAVVDAILEHLDRRAEGRPLFLFAHFFDAHSPWETEPAAVGMGGTAAATSVDGSSAALERLVRATREGTASVPDRQEARRRYLAEVAAMDAALGRLLSELGRRKSGDRLVVVVGDHGEALGRPQLRPYGHGIDVDLEVVHVPLVLHGTGRFALPRGQQTTPVGLMDVAPTVAGLAGLPALGSGRSLVSALRGAPLEELPVFAEATKPSEFESTDAWNNRAFEKGVALGGLWLSRSEWEGTTQVQPLSADVRPLAPGAAIHQERTTELHRVLDVWAASDPPHRHEQLSAETRAALQALGYLEAETDPGAAPEP